MNFSWSFWWFLTFWPWHCFRKTSFITKWWLIEISYLIWKFLVTRSLYWYQGICSCDYGHLWIWSLLGAFVFHKHFLFINERLQILYEVKSSGVGPGFKVFSLHHFLIYQQYPRTILTFAFFTEPRKNKHKCFFFF